MYLSVLKDIFTSWDKKVKKLPDHLIL